MQTHCGNLQYEIRPESILLIQNCNQWLDTTHSLRYVCSMFYPFLGLYTAFRFTEILHLELHVCLCIGYHIARYYFYASFEV